MHQLLMCYVAAIAHDYEHRCGALNVRIKSCRIPCSIVTCPQYGTPEILTIVLHACGT